MYRRQHQRPACLLLFHRSLTRAGRSCSARLSSTPSWSTTSLSCEWVRVCARCGVHVPCQQAGRRGFGAEPLRRWLLCISHAARAKVQPMHRHTHTKAFTHTVHVRAPFSCANAPLPSTCSTSMTSRCLKNTLPKCQVRASAAAAHRMQCSGLALNRAIEPRLQRKAFIACLGHRVPYSHDSGLSGNAGAPTPALAAAVAAPPAAPEPASFTAVALAAAAYSRR